jgi:hypothetical protein
MNKSPPKWILVVSPAALWASTAYFGYRVIHEFSARPVFRATPNQSADLAPRRSM